jgi:hypothetical protein
MENFDFFSLVSFLKACPAMESFFLLVSMVTSQSIDAKKINYLELNLPSPQITVSVLLVTSQNIDAKKVNSQETFAFSTNNCISSFGHFSEHI